MVLSFFYFILFYFIYLSIYFFYFIYLLIRKKRLFNIYLYFSVESLGMDNILESIVILISLDW